MLYIEFSFFQMNTYVISHIEPIKSIGCDLLASYVPSVSFSLIHLQSKVEK